MATWIVGGVVLLVVCLIIRSMYRDRKAGKGCCGDCSKCSSCH
ncbi:MAG: FeoB-associated Cys-rich membrane protein [Clostridiales bacterium]|nr:FeoB-associated Cys-rich membrane protein [Clostridiales bacterium]